MITPKLQVGDLVSIRVLGGTRTGFVSKANWDIVTGWNIELVPKFTNKRGNYDYFLWQGFTQGGRIIKINGVEV